MAKSSVSLRDLMKGAAAAGGVYDGGSTGVGDCVGCGANGGGCDGGGDLAPLGLMPGSPDHAEG